MKMPGLFERAIDSETYKGGVSVDTRLFLAGKFTEGAKREAIDLYDPARGTFIAKASIASVEDVDAAVDAAHAALQTSWGTNVSAPARAKLLFRLADLVEQRTDELAALETLNSGRNFLQAQGHDIPDVAANLRYYAGWADKHHGQTIETEDGRLAYTRHEPIGVCGLIVPWNFPLLLTIWKVAPALATGNCIVLKPSELTPLTALKFAALTQTAGFPPGVINVLPGYGATVGHALTAHMRIAKVSFTGSTAVGRAVMEAAARSNLKRVTLELGGKSPTIVFPDADLADAVPQIVTSLFVHSGQACVAGTRIYIHERIYDTLVPLLVRAAHAFALGDGFDPHAMAGPLISQAQLDRVLGYIEAGKAAGATLLAGGARADRAGYFVQPTLFADVPAGASIATDEIFGPVGVLAKFRTESEVLAMANDSAYGLTAHVFTASVDTALRVARALHAGSAFVNMFSLLCPQVPFGGTKASGFGRQLGQAALDEYTVLKAVHIRVRAAQDA
ncbi:aldehyde dehydrogenase [Phanerochaete sordida]|uniref:Aldehyde dehydrogenase n=1 Tax=Phanerochaete sordida TaxID=48140 RepID=A0A9P3LE44_9APHY|nr:aldehyde dehydrogenase [Phanerochaete sordida]